MSRKHGIAVLIVAGFTGVAAHYGGWATVTVENLPDHLVVGAPYNLTFSVRQHGRDLLPDLSPSVQLKSERGDVMAPAVATNRPGYYTATINVPAEGDWSATVESGFHNSKLKLMPLAALPRGARLSKAVAPAERGQRLFVAKGCVMCHTHAQTAEYGAEDVGPNLTERKFAAGYLREFLADPSIKRPTNGRSMPKLDLSSSDINALTAFINGKGAVRTAAGR